jgi:hypothetical protein
VFLHGFQERSDELWIIYAIERRVQNEQGDTDIILSVIKTGESFALPATAQLCDLCVGLNAVTEVVRIPGGRDS